MSRESLLALLYFVLCFLYALVRYVHFGTTSPQQIPAWITNKAFAFACVPVLFHGALALGRGALEAFQRWARIFRGFALTHVLLVVALMGPLAYPKLFPEGRMGWKGELVVLAGVLCAVTLRLSRDRVHPWLLLAVAALGIHLAFLGFPSWFTPAAWPGHMPPITLLAFLGACIAALRLLALPGSWRASTPA